MRKNRKIKKNRKRDITNSIINKNILGVSA